MHWGDTIERGSEHMIDGKPYAAEVSVFMHNYRFKKSFKMFRVMLEIMIM